jgi:hemerythrin-like domain-containing protein
MNSATKNLENDHIYILRLTDIMEQITQSNEPDIEHIEKIVGIIRNFADGLHHAKEEEHLFPYLGEKGFSTTQGPVAVMLLEHEQGRSFVRGIVDNVILYKKGNRSVVGEIYSNMIGYASLLRNHIAKENNILFKMADRVLSEEDHLLLTGQYAEAEKRNGAGSADYIRQIEELASKYITN